MKNRPPMTHFQGICSEFEKVALKNQQKKSKKGTKAVKSMPQQLVKPPARVWDKIEAILDEQEKRRNNTDELIASSIGHNFPELKRKKVY
jgi:hypothetical protein